MEKNNVLLSQSEIDTLLSFLLDKKTNVSSEIMDQKSIDKLIGILQSQDTPRLRFDSFLPAAKPDRDNFSLRLPDDENTGASASACSLVFEELPSGQAELYCMNSLTARRFRITPSCYEQMRFLEDENSHWGFCIPPIVFDSIAGLLQVHFTKETYTRVCTRFAAVLYGNPEAVISPLYLPSDASLLEHIAV